ncbi:HEAT repeat-containing protein [Fontibacillus panacisegetis]|uniref:HEAT repeat-containing protein n=1 Tax=Fontibacillus panacisegetis TaxID=670482 RepID=A0A1G7K9Z6_9BACL|nr:HEAT repeat domain-containing protein [Fontibacillus panacisegetis]SDF34002.1 HEAT repeat-containing protein [Fontibacillus panacisegetis]
MSTEENVNIEEQPVTYEDLKKSANRSANWRERLQAVEELGQEEWNSEQTIQLLTRIMENDSVRRVQEAAHHSLKNLGERVQLPAKKQEELVKGLTKTLVRIKKSLPEGHSYEEFKEKLKKMRIDIYDTYEGDKGADFDTWLEEKWASLRTRKY